MQQCKECERDFPPDVIQPMVTGGAGQPTRHIPCCPLCALEIMNEEHGINRTKFDGPIAESMRKKALQHLRLHPQQSKRGPR